MTTIFPFVCALGGRYAKNRVSHPKESRRPLKIVLSFFVCFFRGA